MVPIIKIERMWQNVNETFGTCTVIGNENMPLFSSLCVERGWRNNKKSVSCIPKDSGPYEVVWEYSNKFKRMLWEIKGVPNRSETKFHVSNYWHDLNGCIALGRRPKDIDKDGYMDVTSSTDTINDFHRALKHFDKAILVIVGKQNIS